MERKHPSDCAAVAGESPRTGPRRVLFALLLPLAMMGVLFSTACSSSAPPPSSAAGPVRYLVVADETSFFKYGPAQANGADYKLKRGREVVMLERHYGYSRVETDVGDSGYVPTDDIEPSPNQPNPNASPAKKPAGSIPSRGRGAGRTPDFDQPNDAALPSGQPPNDVPVPSFRY